MNRGYNFGAGPAMLPEAILLEAKEELLNWQDLGMSVLEIGHRTAPYAALMEEAEQGIRELLAIPPNYQVLFLGGAARTQFAMIPMNLLGTEGEAGYFVTGLWSNLAYEEARKLKKAYCITNAASNGFTDIPAATDWQIKENSAYLYFTSNETVNGIRFPEIPTTAGIPLIADMTSSLLSEPIHVADYGLIFAGAQKNIANAGLTLVIIRDDLLNHIEDNKLPTMLDYRTHSQAKSLYATPPTFNCYLATKMFQWIKNQGGVQAVYEINCQKADTLYRYIDNSDFYHCAISKKVRSLMNVCFTLQDVSLEAIFLEKAKGRGLLALKGHRTVGGLRASIYNSMPLEGVERLIEFMTDFAKEYQQ